MLQIILAGSDMFCRPMKTCFQANKGDPDACYALALMLMAGCSTSIRLCCVTHHQQLRSTEHEALGELHRPQHPASNRLQTAHHMEG